MPLPDYIIAGAQRSGTTSLHNWLMAHPNVWDSGEPLREIHYLTYPHLWEKGVDWYVQQFADVPRGKLIGEKSPTYLDHPLAPIRLRQVNPNAKIIFCLRNPVDRALSHWRKARAKGFEPDKLWPAIRLEPLRLSDEINEWNGAIWTQRYYLSCHHVRCYLRRGRYVEHIGVWLTQFPREQILLLRSEDLFADPAREYLKALHFLGLPTVMLPEWKHYQALPKEDQVGGKRVRQWLTAYFASYNAALAQLLGDDRWLWGGR